MFPTPIRIQPPDEVGHRTAAEEEALTGFQDRPVDFGRPLYSVGKKLLDGAVGLKSAGTAEQSGVEVPMPGEVFEQADGDGFDIPIAAAGVVFLQRCLVAGQTCRLQKRIPVREVLVQGHSGDSGPLGKIGHADIGGVPLVDQRRGGSDQGGPGPYLSRVRSGCHSHTLPGIRA